MLSIDEGKAVVKLARDAICGSLDGNKHMSCAIDTNGEGFLNERRGVFVTIHSYPSHELRGCIGFISPPFSFIEALKSAAVAAATEDPRFEPISEKELKKIVIEVSVLTEPVLISGLEPKDYIKNINTGEDGLIIKKGHNSGLLLPQVARECNMDAREFLMHTCLKAGLMDDAYLDKATKVFKFRAQVFSEKKPCGEVIEIRH